MSASSLASAPCPSRSISPSSSAISPPPAGSTARSSAAARAAAPTTWVDFDFFGNQISVPHHRDVMPATQNTGKVEDIAGADAALRRLLDWDEFAGARRPDARRRHAVHHRAARALRRPAGRAGDDVPPRSRAATRSSSRLPAPEHVFTRMRRHRHERAAVVVMGGGVDRGERGLPSGRARVARRASCSSAPTAPGAGSTGRATGGFRAQFATAINVRLSLLARETLRTLPRADGGRPRLRAGGLSLARALGGELEMLRARPAVQQAAGLAEAVEVDPEEHRARQSRRRRSTTCSAAPAAPPTASSGRSRFSRAITAAARRHGAVFA